MSSDAWWNALKYHINRWRFGLAKGIRRMLKIFTPRFIQKFLARAFIERDLALGIETVGPLLNRTPDLDHLTFDIPVTHDLCFEHLVGLHASNNLNSGVSDLTIRMAAYLFDTLRRLKATKVIEIGRYKGGTTFLMAAAMGKKGTVWSIDIGEKESRLHKENKRPFDVQLTEKCRQFGFQVHVLVGDSRTVECETGTVDLVIIDGEHTYDAVKSDFERFGKRVRVGGAVFFDDCSGEGTFADAPAYMKPLIREIEAAGQFKLVKTVDRLGHFERIAK
ncbi:MAG: hypothetical protein COV74_03215 [Candidatus Omnitrophica bacterium CG11_big_fil_rev_8_21_14_0_20_45_26]|uniref:Methyltransferase n=1 Tax=Candidatus Abzuiibacterium crystallinum TaxID=1974748 RepID=A0A2H0LTN2_9BACT|nr:MAG: hypothetical protein COV74_03215 [Candidatus Omnitrophica bacterium CG11_big_fil_rev_8_21_14_0_20_45_26]PIW64685.1 MAG: hypothetical protein COW12_05240 [Candidatus Omnitrophica bacterium CG12_big_fil_rev_8_21_14_0_65_45_16]